MKVDIVSYEENIKPDSHLLGFFTIHMPEEKIIIARMTDCQKGEQKWIGMPTYSQKDPRDPTKWQFYSIVKFAPDKQKEFLEECRKSLKEFKQKLITNNKE